MILLYELQKNFKVRKDKVLQYIRIKAKQLKRNLLNVKQPTKQPRTDIFTGSAIGALGLGALYAGNKIFGGKVEDKFNQQIVKSFPKGPKRLSDEFGHPPGIAQTSKAIVGKVTKDNDDTLDNLGKIGMYGFAAYGAISAGKKLYNKLTWNKYKF